MPLVFSVISTCLHRPASPFAGYHAFSPSVANVATWYFDTGATHHMTNSGAVFDDLTPYHGKEYVLVGNGASFPISQTSSLPLTFSSV